MRLFESSPAAVSERLRPLVDGRYIATDRGRKPDRLARRHGVAAMISSMRQGDVEGVVDALKTLGVDVTRLH